MNTERSIVAELPPKVTARRVEIESAIRADTHERARVVVVECPDRGYCAEAHDGGDGFGPESGTMMAGGPWRWSAMEALDALALEWAEGCE